MAALSHKSPKQLNPADDIHHMVYLFRLATSLWGQSGGV